MTNQPNSPGPSLNSTVTLQLREVLAVLGTLGPLRNLLDDPNHAEAVATVLVGLGAPGRNDELPATSTLSAAPHVADVETARDYVTALIERIKRA